MSWVFLSEWVVVKKRESAPFLHSFTFPQPSKASQIAQREMARMPQ
jgi:hypothetical protein